MIQFQHGAGAVMTMPKRSPTMPTVKALLDTHEQLSTSFLRGVEFENVEDVLGECPIEELKKRRHTDQSGATRSLRLSAPFRSFDGPPEQTDDRPHFYPGARGSGRRNVGH